MELLTNRLMMMAEQVNANHMVELIDNERIELERLRHYRPYREEKKSTFVAVTAQSQIRKSKFGNAVMAKHRSALSRNKKEESKENTNEDDQKNLEEGPKIKEITTVCDIWGLSKKMKDRDY